MFRADLAALFAAHLLAERCLWEPFPAGAIPTRIALETADEVDDVRIDTSAGGRIWVQAKRSVGLSSRLTSPLGEAVDQMVRQYVRGPRLDPAIDRLVLAYSEATGPVERLYGVIRRFHSDGPRRDDVRKSEAERQAFAKFEALMQGAWKRAYPRRRQMPLADIQSFLRLVVFWCLPAGLSGRLDGSPLLADVVEGDTLPALEILRSFMLTLAKEQRGADLEGLRAELRNGGVVLKEPPSYRQDFAALRRVAERHLARLEGEQFLRWQGQPLQIVRVKAQETLVAADAGALAIVGEPGVGKSTLLTGLARELIGRGRQVFTLVTGEIGATSLDSLERELRLQHAVTDVFANVPDPRPAYLLIDALDAARGNTGVAQMLRQLMEAARAVPDGWRVVATVRRSHLLNAPELCRLFARDQGRLPPRDLSGLVHLKVGRLDGDELGQLEGQAPELARFIRQASPRLRDLLRVPFNLRIAAELGAGDQLSAVESRSELLDYYWSHRVEGVQHGDRRVEVMRALSRHSLSNLTTRAPRSALTDALAVDELIQDGVLVGGSDGHVEASHHIVLDFAIARTLLYPDAGTALVNLEDAGPATLYFRSSILLWLESLWRRHRSSFWRMVLSAMKGTMPGAARVAIAQTLISYVDDVSALDVLREALQTEGDEPSAATHAFRFLSGTLGALGPRVPSSLPWLRFIEQIAPAASGRIWSVARGLIDTLLRPPLAPDDRRNAASAARALFEAAWCRHRDRLGWAADPLIKTFSWAPVEGAQLLRGALEAALDGDVREVLTSIVLGLRELLEQPDLVLRHRRVDMFTQLPWPGQWLVEDRPASSSRALGPR